MCKSVLPAVKPGLGSSDFPESHWVVWLFFHGNEKKRLGRKDINKAVKKYIESCGSKGGKESHLGGDKVQMSIPPPSSVRG